MELRLHVVKHGFVFRFADIADVENAVGFSVDGEMEFETIELIGNIVISWDSGGTGYRL